MDVPMAIVRSSLTQMRQIQADESLRAMQAIAMGTGSYEKPDAERLLRAWRQTADGGREQSLIVRPGTDQLAHIGIGVTVVERP